MLRKKKKSKMWGQNESIEPKPMNQAVEMHRAPDVHRAPDIHRAPEMREHRTIDRTDSPKSDESNLWVLYLLAILLACYFLGLFLHDQFYYYARMQLLQSQAAPLNADSLPESQHNVFAAIREHERMVRG